jgi:ABC-2 type transport system ATP-binding protein
MWDFISEINNQGTTIILTTHYLEEAEQLCKNIAIIDKGKIVENTSMKELLSKLDVQSFVLDLNQPLNNLPIISGYTMTLSDPSTLVVAIEKDKSINEFFTELSKIGISVKSMRNESNRLEELFMEIVKSND